MTLEERLDFCKICENRKINLQVGLVCSLTNKKPEFENKCEFFIKDEKEAERKLKLKLDATGTSRSQNGSLVPSKNINYGIFFNYSWSFNDIFNISFIWRNNIDRRNFISN
jgi:hypothetical protein